MYIDIGVSSKAEVEAAGVQPGDPVYPNASFVEMASGKTYLSKAFDDRVGVALALPHCKSCRRRAPQRPVRRLDRHGEVGLRGATTSVRAVDPDVALSSNLILPATCLASSPTKSTVKLGKGPTLIIYEARMIPNLALRQLIMDVAKEIGVNHCSFPTWKAAPRWRRHPPARHRRAHSGYRRGSPPHPLPQLHPAPRRFRRGPQAAGSSRAAAG